jgi:DNA-directed RNA polymerase subunit RPC12/RpoP
MKTTIYRLQYKCRSCYRPFVPSKPTDHLCVTCASRTVVRWYVTYAASVGIIMGWLLAQGCKP